MATKRAVLAMFASFLIFEAELLVKRFDQQRFDQQPPPSFP
jgi:hypothetical protein